MNLATIKLRTDPLLDQELEELAVYGARDGDVVMERPDGQWYVCRHLTSDSSYIKRFQPSSALARALRARSGSVNAAPRLTLMPGGRAAR